MPRVVLPGDFIIASAHSNLSNEKRIIGAGLEKRIDGVFAVVPGILREKDNKIWISSSSKRYTPIASDRILGVVIARFGDYFKIDIGAADLALLSFMSFEGATKRNRPNIRVGDLVYGQVILSSKHIEPELSCIDSEGRARGMGAISTPGLVFNISLNYARRLLSTEDNFLSLLGKNIRFENIIGMNGKIWVTADNPRTAIAVQTALIAAETTFESNRSLLVDIAIRESQNDLNEKVEQMDISEDKKS